jgi:uncharacterized membrane protein
MKKIGLLFVFILLFAAFAAPAMAQSNPVRAVLFYSPTCGHCELVIRQVLPPLFAEYGGEVEALYIPPAPEQEDLGPPIVGFFGEELQVLYVNTYSELGNELFSAAMEEFEVMKERPAVPTLIVEEIVLVGSAEIPDRLPGIVAEGLASGGTDWADIPGLQEAITSMEPIPEAASGEGETENQSQAGNSDPVEPPEAEAATNGDDPALDPPASASNPETNPPSVEQEAVLPGEVNLSITQRILLDPVGNTLSIIVLIGMVISLAGVLARAQMVTPKEPATWQIVGIPLLVAIGIGVASYLLYVESNQVTAVCGPIGDCNTVQQSQYAMLFGAIPIAGLGLLGYLAILASWALGRLKLGMPSELGAIGAFVFALIGTFFSIYLTFLEPFVIGATCAWCLSSAVIMTLILWLTVDPAILAWKRLQSKQS